MGTFIELLVKVPEETRLESFDYISRLGLTETLTSATATATVWIGTDASPSSVISGSASISGTVVTQGITGGIDGCIYLITVTAYTSLSQTLIIQSLLAVQADQI